MESWTECLFIKYSEWNNCKACAGCLVTSGTHQGQGIDTLLLWQQPKDWLIFDHSDVVGSVQWQFSPRSISQNVLHGLFHPPSQAGSWLVLRVYVAEDDWAGRSLQHPYWLKKVKEELLNLLNIELGKVDKYMDFGSILYTLISWQKLGSNKRVTWIHEETT